jgi:hypothetical protein
MWKAILKSELDCELIRRPFQTAIQNEARLLLFRARKQPPRLRAGGLHIKQPSEFREARSIGRIKFADD